MSNVASPTQYPMMGGEGMVIPTMVDGKHRLVFIFDRDEAARQLLCMYVAPEFVKRWDMRNKLLNGKK